MFEPPHFFLVPLMLPPLPAPYLFLALLQALLLQPLTMTPFSFIFVFISAQRLFVAQVFLL